jgi:hypothetical protein
MNHKREILKNYPRTGRMKNIIIKKFESDFVLKNEDILFNVNNCFNNTNTARPLDYFEQIDKGNTKNWIDKFHANKYKKLTLKGSDLVWIKEAYYTIGQFTLRFPHFYIPELENTIKTIDFPNGYYFVRTEKVSLKYGMHGVGPYTTLKKIIESMVTTVEGHTCFNPNDLECNIYLMNWVSIDTEKEFRVFVNNNMITAISTQHYYSPNKWLNSLSNEEIKDIIYGLLKYFEEHVKEKLSFMQNYTMDIALTDNGWYFIEPNSFGCNYAAGSALFHWILDHEKLHDSTCIEFRYAY